MQELGEAYSIVPLTPAYECWNDEFNPRLDEKIDVRHKVES